MRLHLAYLHLTLAQSQVYCQDHAHITTANIS